jgi:inner membrane protein
MSPGAHLLSSWLIANSLVTSQRERRIVTLAGLAPDMDAIGWLADRVNLWGGDVTDYYFQYHHLLVHNLFAGVVVSALACALAKTRRLLVFGLSLAVFHLHLICDLAGSRGPDGYQWPIHYLYPFYPEFEWTWSGQWELSGWQNTAITLTILAIAMTWAWKQRYSFVQVISAWLDREFFKMLERYGISSDGGSGNRF